MHGHIEFHSIGSISLPSRQRSQLKPSFPWQCTLYDLRDLQTALWGAMRFYLYLIGLLGITLIHPTLQMFENICGVGLVNTEPSRQNRLSASKRYRLDLI